MLFGNIPWKYPLDHVFFAAAVEPKLSCQQQVACPEEQEDLHNISGTTVSKKYFFNSFIFPKIS